MKSNVLLHLAVILCCVLGFTASASAGPPRQSSGFLALNGEAAQAFQLPADMVMVREQARGPRGLTILRYQQMFGEAEVLGGQLTLQTDRTGEIAAVVGAHYPDVVAQNKVRLDKAQAQEIVAARIGNTGEWQTTLMIDPEAGRFFYRVENRRFDSRWFLWIDAETGDVLNAYDGLTTGSGTGVLGDTKNLTGLTTKSGSVYIMESADGRQTTYDAKNRFFRLPGKLGQDDDDLWTTSGRTSPGHPALVDAHFYARVTDNFLQEICGFDWLDVYPQGMVSSAHLKKNYANAYWNGYQMAYGDGDGVVFLEMSADLDVVAHELTHGVTEATSNLIYQNESGALNEAFSDIMSAAAEFYNGTGNWTVGEDLMPNDDGIRDMADPGADDQPSHYGDWVSPEEPPCAGTSDEGNGCVHINSGIANHWFYLLVNGGQNANPERASGTNVVGIGLAAAEEIAYLGFTSLPENATFCTARTATTAAATSADKDNVADAWDEVGVVCPK